MKILIINNSSKKDKLKINRAISEYLPCLGRNVYSGDITENGCAILRDKVKSSSSKNASVICHKISNNGSLSILWTAGNINQFSENGDFAFKYKKKERAFAPLPDELREFRAVVVEIAYLTGIFHDMGKNFYYFQNKLSGIRDDENIVKKNRFSDPVRHEKLSYDLLMGFFDKYCSGDLVESLKALKENIGSIIKTDYLFLPNVNSLAGKKRSLFKQNSILGAIAQLTLTHHRISGMKADHTVNSTYTKNFNQFVDVIKLYEDQDFVYKRSSIKQAITGSVDNILEVLEHSKNKDSLYLKLSNTELMSSMVQFILRPSFIMADQYFSSKDFSENPRPEYSVEPYANKIGGEKLNQTLEEHLLGVAVQAKKISRYFFNLLYVDSSLSELNFLEKAKERFYKKTPMKLWEQFGWQDEVVSSIQKTSIPSLIENEDRFGFIGVIMSKTGSGKTIGNMKVLSQVCQDDSMRATCLLGMKSLTLQTLNEYQDYFKLRKKELTGIIGSSDTLSLYKANKNHQEKSSLEEEIEDLKTIDIYSQEKIVTPKNLKFLNFKENDSKVSKILLTPIVICTVDYMVSGFSSYRSSKTKYLMRLMSSDLILDEVDSYSPKQLISILKIVYLSGLYGRKVVISSATLSNTAIKALHDNYLKGFHKYAQTKEIQSTVFAGLYSHEHDCIETDLIENVNVDSFISKFKERLINEPSKNIISVLKDNQDSRSINNLYRTIVRQSLLNSTSLSIQDEGGVSFSTGLIKILNIKHITELSKQWHDDSFLDIEQEFPDTLIKIETYHSRNFEIKKSFQEFQLNKLLRRKDDSKLISSDIYQNLKQEALSKGKTKILVLVIASPIIETGRDFDFDWAITEVRDHRSLVQTSGRVRRHRSYHSKEPNIFVLDKSLHYYQENREDSLYINPGFETGLKSNDKLKDFILKKDLSSFEDVFEFKEGDNINAKVTIDEVAVNPAKKSEVALLKAFIEDSTKDENFSFSIQNFHDSLKNIFTMNHVELSAFRESSATKTAIWFGNESKFNEPKMSNSDISKKDLENTQRVLIKENLEEVLYFYKKNNDYIKNKNLTFEYYENKNNDIYFDFYIGQYV